MKGAGPAPLGRVALVGAGPGRADLLTVRAAQLLSQAGAVLYDRLVSHEVLSLAPAGTEFHHVGKEEGQQEEVQHRIYSLLEECAARHALVVRLKGGDPMVFGRGGEEWLWLAQRGIEVEVVPGVSAAIAVPSLAGMPPTFRHRAGGFAVVAGHRCAGGCEDWAPYARVDTLVILMAVRNRAQIAGCLIAHGRRPDEPAAFIENGTTPRERVLVTTLGQVAAGAILVHSPAVMVVGEVVTLREALLNAPDLHAMVDLPGFVEGSEADAWQAR